MSIPTGARAARNLLAASFATLLLVAPAISQD